MPSLQKVENVEMIAFCDVDISKAASAAEAYGTDNAKVYDDYKALLKDDTIDGTAQGRINTVRINFLPLTTG
ncbi:hypothetical protein APW96_14360 [Staphylococcus aureus]|nr:hypothetical protein APW96_14360 [Staphylococcus aureus]